MSVLDMASYAEYVANPSVRSTAPRGAGLVISMGHIWKSGVIVFTGTPAECKDKYLELRYPARKAEVVAPVVHDAHVQAMRHFWGEDGPSWYVGIDSEVDEDRSEPVVAVKAKAKRAPRAKKVAA